MAIYIDVAQGWETKSDGGDPVVPEGVLSENKGSGTKETCGGVSGGILVRRRRDWTAAVARVQ